MKCNNCTSTEAIIENDPLYSKYLCLDCGYYYWEDGQEEIEINSYCLLVINLTIYQPVATRRALLKILRSCRLSTKQQKVTLRKYFSNKSLFREKVLLL